MKLYSLITVYHHDHDTPVNPLIQVHLVTTDGALAQANYERMVAHEIAEGYNAVGKYGNQTELQDAEHHMTIRLHLSTEPVEFTFGRSQW